MASYFGLRVEVISRMEDCSLIRFQGREFVVDTADLVTIRGFVSHDPTLTGTLSHPLPGYLINSSALCFSDHQN